MSVPKSKRKQSKVEFEMLIFKVCESVDRLVETRFSADPDELAANQIFINSRSTNLERLTDSLIYHIKVANSIYPKCMAEWEERRVSIGKAVGTCYAILTNLQRVMIRLRVPAAVCCDVSEPARYIYQGGESREILRPIHG